MANLKILLADDHAVVREGLKRLIETAPDMDVVAEAEDGEEAIAKTAANLPDVVVMDVSMRPVGGAQATRELRRRCPAASVLALTVHEDRSYLQELFEAGASGYVLKRAAPDELLQAIRTVAGGSPYIDVRMTGKLVSGLLHPRSSAPRGVNVPSEREGSVMRLIARGYTNKEIAAQLNVSVKTIETYKARAMEKLGLRTRVDIVRMAAECGWLQPDPR
jgi:DNA-binding NarL/FixJ family response regulator